MVGIHPALPFPSPIVIATTLLSAATGIGTRRIQRSVRGSSLITYPSLHRTSPHVRHWLVFHRGGGPLGPFFTRSRTLLPHPPSFPRLLFTWTAAAPSVGHFCRHFCSCAVSATLGNRFAIRIPIFHCILSSTPHLMVSKGLLKERDEVLLIRVGFIFGRLNARTEEGRTIRSRRPKIMERSRLHHRRNGRGTTRSMALLCRVEGVSGPMGMKRVVEAGGEGRGRKGRRRKKRGLSTALWHPSARGRRRIQTMEATTTLSRDSALMISERDRWPFESVQRQAVSSCFLFFLLLPYR